MKTNDAGDSWNVLGSLPDCDTHQTMFWKSTDTAWSACALGAIFKTTNGGVTWNKINTAYVNTSTVFHKVFLLVTL